MNEMLLSGEKLLATRPANLTFGFDPEAKLPDGSSANKAGSAIELLVRVAPQLVKPRSIGGKVHITSFRIYFASHRLNTTHGTCSIFFPNIVFEEPVTGVFAGQWVVKTATVTHRFAVRDAKELSQLVRHTRENALDVEALKTAVNGDLEKASSGITPLWPASKPTAAQLKGLEETLTAKKAGPIQVVGLMNALELLSR
ncbi:MAG: hypothetical protein IPJ65_43740 [Archangiaceae bacterium]|nr:hypothetical protein [Archangiaceae bacterium]